MIGVEVWLHPRQTHALSDDEVSDYAAQVAARFLRDAARRAGRRLVGQPETLYVVRPGTPEAAVMRDKWRNTSEGAWGVGVALAYVEQDTRRAWFRFTGSRTAP